MADRVKRRTFLRGIVGTVAAGGLLQACQAASPQPVTTSAGTTATAPTVRRPLHVAFWNENKSFEGFAPSRFNLPKYGIAEPLLRTGFDSKPELVLATSIESVDATTWRFTLR